MNTAFIVSLAGVDRPNLIQELAKYTHDLDGKWINSRVTYLDGHLAANIKVELPADNKGTLIKYFSELEKCACYTEDIDLTDEAPAETAKLTLKSSDRSGLVSDITHVVNQQKAELVHIENHRFSVTSIGGNVFTAEIDVKIATGATVEDLVSELKTITDDMIVTIED